MDDPSKQLELSIQAQKALRFQKDEELRRAKEAAEAANAARGQFLANMSHEMRTPLAAVIGFAQALKRGQLSEADEKEAIDTIISSGNYLLDIVNDILDLSKIDAGALRIENMVVILEDLFEEVRRIAEPSAREKGLILEFSISSELPAALHTDPLRLRQVLINLVSNSVKFTKTGKIEVRAQPGEDSRSIRFAVEDTGIGISEEQLPRIFKPFGQADSSTTRRFGGTGLGLAICSRLAEMLGGNLSVTSVLGEGSVFTLTLRDLSFGSPDQVFESEQIKESPKNFGRLKGRVLVADDVRSNQRLVSFLLHGTGLELMFADNGRQVIDILDTTQVDAILMDLQMPEMDGLTATRLLRAQGVDLPIIAFSANAMQEDINRCIEAGCTGYLAKPFRQDEMFEVLSQALKLSGSLQEQRELASDVEQDEEERDEELIELKQEWLSELPQRFAEIKAAIAAEDYEVLLRLAHKVRGTAGLLGFEQIFETAGKLEDAAREEKFEEIEAYFNQLQKLVN